MITALHPHPAVSVDIMDILQVDQDTRFAQEWRNVFSVIHETIIVYEEFYVLEYNAV
jgi:hypothetical protein